MYVTHDHLVTGDSEGVDFDEVPTVKLDESHSAALATDASDVPDVYGDGFDADEFYVLENRPIARPIVQTYHTRDGAQQWGKPRSELKRAAWSVDNSPLTLNHPDSVTGMARKEHVHGFWRDAWYDEDDDALRADAYVPTTDVDAVEYLEAHGDVSIGFTHDERPADEDDLSGVQTNILVDHVAAVPRGRCSEEDGCTLSTDMDEHGHMRTLTADEATRVSDGPVTHDQPEGIHVADDTWYAVSPEEHTKDSTDHADDAMYPVGTCSDVNDAWNLRNHAEDLTIDQSTLAARIRRAGEAMDCEMPETAQDSESTIMSDIEFDADDLTVDALAERHDGVAELVSERDQYREDAETLEEIEETLDVSEEECACDAIAQLSEDAESYKNELLDYRADERTEVIEDIESYTTRFDGEYEEMSLDELRELKETVSDVAAEVTEGDSSPTGVETDSDPDGGAEGRERRQRVWLRD